MNVKYARVAGKGFLPLLVLCLLISGCKDPTSTASNPSPVSNIPVSETTAADTAKEYLNPDSTKGEAYQAAINAYNAFLNGEGNAKITDVKNGEDTNQTISIHDLDAINGGSGIDRFALFDVNRDGIPELHTRSLTYHVFSYQDGRMVLRYEAPVNLMNGTVDVLENGALFTMQESTGKFYEYAAFDSNGVDSIVRFSEPSSPDDQGVSEDVPYVFMDREVSKEEYTRLTADYLALSKEPASLTWADYQ